MTRDEIVRVAQKALKKVVTEDYPGHAGKLDHWTICLLERFAELTVAHEREACAKVCEPQDKWDDPLTAHTIAAAIRARGQS